MQRQKEPLEFSESPYAGTRHCKSPVLAAQQPSLTSAISAETLDTQWVLPQFPCKSNAGQGGENKCKKTEYRRARKGKEKKQIVHGKENNFFPALDLLSSRDKSSVLPNEQTNIVQRSKQANYEKTSKSNEIIVGGAVNNMNLSRNRFLFSLGSPKPSTVIGKILAFETPDNGMCERLRDDKIWQNDTTSQF